MRALLVIIPLVFAAPPAAAEQHDSPIGVAVYMPSIFFASATDKARFLSGVEEVCGAALGRPVQASFSASLDRAMSDPIWIVDAAHALMRPGVTIIKRAHRDGKSTAPVAIYATKTWPNAYTLLEKGNVGLPGESAVERLTLRYWLLSEEPGASNISAKAKSSRDARALLTAVAAGTLDGAVLFRANYRKLEPKLDALREVTSLADMPLPVLAVSPKANLPGAVVEKLRTVTPPSVDGLIDGWRATSNHDLVPLEASLRRRVPRIPRDLVLAALPPLQVDLTDLLPEPPPPPPLQPSLVFPPAEDAPLPDPPDFDGEPPAAATSRLHFLKEP